MTFSRLARVNRAGRTINQTINQSVNPTVNPTVKRSLSTLSLGHHAVNPIASYHADSRGSPSIRYPPRSIDRSVNQSNPPVDSYYGCNVFDRRTVKQYLNGADYNRYIDAITNYRSIDASLADAISAALLRWATERGATHFAHWFQPVNGSTAEKHDTFVDVARDGETPIIRFNGKQLIMGEPDGSSFPSGGLRATHLARGYTAWDPNSPPFILEHDNGSTLYIPSCFFSWNNGQALDEKIPLLRSEVALQRETLRLFSVLGETAHTHIHMDAGLEQEFFLVDRKYYLARPDLMACGRTVVGCPPPKNQELEDQYFGHISNRFLDMIHDFEVECWKLGIPVQTRHREVAPGQYEIAPKFAPANVGTDRNLIVMQLLHKISRKHGLTALLHEKPFAGVNGSGKHNNWSMGTNLIPSLLNPGPKPEANATFMLFLAATIRAIDTHADLMRFAICGAGNDHRLGANEAPPAIVSVYLGDDIEAAVDRFITNDNTPSTFESQLDLGISALPNLHRVPTDRNRTSTFAFTGNKFEFRSVGASHNPSRSCQVINTIVAESLNVMSTEIETLMKSGESAASACRTVTANSLQKHRRVIFNGNGYSHEWEVEAASRGLPNYKSTPSALDTFFTPKNVSLFSSLRVLDSTELQARANIAYEDYVKRLSIEAKVLCSMCQQSIAPCAIAYLDQVSQVEQRTGGKIGKLSEVLRTNLQSMLDGVEQLKNNVHKVHGQSTLSAQAHYCEDVLIPAMNEIRKAADTLEQNVPADKWPLPTYHQMMFHQD